MSRHDDERGALGYKRPPVWSQFRKGRSGNPKGRPKKQRIVEPAVAPSESGLLTALTDELGRTIRVTDSDGTTERKVFEVAVRALAAKAVKGDVSAQKTVIELQAYVESEQAVVRAEQKKTDAQTFVYMVKKKTQRSKIWAAAAAGGKEPDQPWPHPDDILVCERRKIWKVRGPFEKADEAYFEFLRQNRDVIFLRSAHWRRKTRRKLGTGANFWDPLWLAFDRLLPKRWQLFDENDPRRLDTAYSFFSHYSLPQLQRRITETEARVEAWRVAANVPPPGKDEYKVANELLKPMLKRKGYRSLAEFEHAYETHGQNMPWPALRR